MTTLKDVAKYANVSTTTVSHVLNETRYVSEDTKMRVFSAIKELSYRPNSVARSLRRQESKIIGLVVPIYHDDSSNLFFMKASQGIEDELSQHGYSLFTSNNNENYLDEQKQIGKFCSQMVDGLIIAPTSDVPPTLLSGEPIPIPIVYVDRCPSKITCDCIRADGYQGVFDTVTALSQMGHKRIGFISGATKLTTGYERMKGYLEAIDTLSLPHDPSLVRMSHSDLQKGYEFAKSLITQNPDMTALVVACNTMSMGVVKYIQEAGISLPKDLALVVFDDYNWTSILSPALSVISQPAFEIGRKAAQILLKRIHKKGGVPEDIRLPTTFIKRGSC